eukprot:9499177-Pyramimonas_sp.AAC.1
MERQVALRRGSPKSLQTCPKTCLNTRGCDGVPHVPRNTQIVHAPRAILTKIGMNDRVRERVAG